MRTTADKVKAVIEVDASIALDVFMETATELVDECCGSSGYSEGRLTLIETWLAAHFYSVRDMRPSVEKAGEVSVSFTQNPGFNLMLTSHGQQALALDTRGGLAALSKRSEQGKSGRVGVVYLGTE